MAKKFAELRAKMSPESQARSAEKTKIMLAEMPLNELRQARGLTQKTLAAALHVAQPAIAKMERKTDMYVSTLRDFVQAMGGELSVTAKFPEGTVKIENFSDLGQGYSLFDPVAASNAARAPRGAAMAPPRATDHGYVVREEAASPSPSPAGRRLAQGT